MSMLLDSILLDQPDEYAKIRIISSIKVDSLELQKYLTEIGLDDKEISVYLTCLQLGEGSIVPIVEKTQLPRTTVFHILERLSKDKLIEIIETETRRIYTPYPPRAILTRLRNRRTIINEQVNAFEDALPELLRMYDVSPFQPKVRMFKGEDIRNIFEDITNTHPETIEYIGETTNIVSVTGERWLKNWIKKRAALEIKSRSIRIASEEIADPMYGQSKELMRTIRYAPTGFQSPMQIYIYGDSVAHISTLAEGFGVIITSQEYATTMRNWFKELWKASSEKPLVSS